MMGNHKDLAASNQVVVRKFMEGEEASLSGALDSKTIVPMLYPGLYISTGGDRGERPQAHTGGYQGLTASPACGLTHLNRRRWKPFCAS